MNGFHAKGKVFGIQIGVVLTALVCFALVSCDSNRPKDPYISVPDAGVTVEDVVLDTDEYVGKQVTVAGTIKGTFGEQAFLIHGEKLVDELLTVGADPYPNEPNETFDYPLAPVKSVRVTGIVRRFNAAEVERETGIKLGDSRLNDYAGNPVLIVESLQRVEP